MPNCLARATTRVSVILCTMISHDGHASRFTASTTSLQTAHDQGLFDQAKPGARFGAVMSAIGTKRTFRDCVPMSAFGTERTFHD